MYYNVYKKPSVNLKKEIWEEGEQMRENWSKQLSPTANWILASRA
jgi:hypothetical protein